MPTRVSGRGIRGRGRDLSAQPGDGALERLLGGETSTVSGSNGIQVDLSPNLSVDKKLNPPVNKKPKRQVGTSIKGRIAKGTSTSGALSPKKKNPGPEPLSDERVKVSFYLSADQRDELDASLVKVRRWVDKLEGRRLDQSALVRAVLGAVIDDFRTDEGRSMLVKWLRAASRG